MQLIITVMVLLTGLLSGLTIDTAVLATKIIAGYLMIYSNLTTPLDIKTVKDHVAVPHQIVPAFLSHFSSVLAGLLST